MYKLEIYASFFLFSTITLLLGILWMTFLKSLFVGRFISVWKCNCKETEWLPRQTFASSIYCKKYPWPKCNYQAIPLYWIIFVCKANIVERPIAPLLLDHYKSNICEVMFCSVRKIVSSLVQVIVFAKLAVSSPLIYRVLDEFTKFLHFWVRTNFGHMLDDIIKN